MRVVSEDVDLSEGRLSDIRLPDYDLHAPLLLLLEGRGVCLLGVVARAHSNRRGLVGVLVKRALDAVLVLGRHRVQPEDLLLRRLLLVLRLYLDLVVARYGDKWTLIFIVNNGMAVGVNLLDEVNLCVLSVTFLVIFCD